MKVKDTVRVVLLNHAGEALMIRVGGGDLHDPKATIRGPFWITPGGRIENGESPEEAVTREVWEETGVRGVTAGPMIGYGEQFLEWKGEPTHLRERFFCVRVWNETVKPANLTPQEQSHFLMYKWWCANDIRSSDETFLPVGLPELVDSILAGGVSGIRDIDLSSPKT